MTKIADKKFEILGYVASGEYSVDGLAEKLNELTRLVEDLPLHGVSCSQINCEYEDRGNHLWCEQHGIAYKKRD